MGSDAVDAVLSRPTDQALKEHVGGNAADLDWCLKLGCAAMSCRAPPVTLSFEEWVGCDAAGAVLSHSTDQALEKQVSGVIVTSIKQQNKKSGLWWIQSW